MRNPALLAIVARLQQCVCVGSDDDVPDHGGKLARAAEPLRSSLRGYFRRRVRDGEEIDDLVQEVFARIVARDSARPIENLAGYIFQTAASVLTDRGRRRATRRADAHVSFDPDRHSDEDFDPARILAGREELRVATAALLSLPERTRTIFVLRRLEGCSNRDVAAQLGISVSAVEKHLVRAVQHLAQAVGRNA